MAIARNLFAYWQEQCGHPQAKLDASRKAKVLARLREGYTPEQVRQAIDGAARHPYIDEKGKRHDGFELICRNGAKLEDFIGRAELPPQMVRGGAQRSSASQRRMERTAQRLAFIGGGR